MEKEIWVALIGLVGAIAAVWFKWYLDNHHQPRVVDDAPVLTHSGTVNMAAGITLSRDGQGMAYGHKFTFAFTTLDEGRVLVFTAEARARQLIAIELFAEAENQHTQPAIITTGRTYTPRLEWMVEPGNYVVAIVAHSDDEMTADFDVSYRYHVE